MPILNVRVEAEVQGPEGEVQEVDPKGGLQQIGRDVLMNSVLIYNGADGSFSIAR